MTAKNIIDDISEETGWDADSKILLLCHFIDKFNDPSLLATFLKQCQVEENEVWALWGGDDE